MHKLIANYKRYVCVCVCVCVCVHLIMVAFKSCYYIDLYGCCRIDMHLAQLLFFCNR
jgi:hypothetical protein